jgi:hypothetical protein
MIKTQVRKKKKVFKMFNINNSLGEILIQFNKLYNENKELKNRIKELSKKPECEIKFAKFHNLTFLYPGGFPGFLEQDDQEEYHLKIRSHITENKNEFNDGDIIFIGSRYESRQYYGFANIEGNDFITGLFPSTGGYDGVYYRDAIDDLNEFWVDLEGLEYFTIHDIKHVKENGTYEP